MNISRPSVSPGLRLTFLWSERLPTTSWSTAVRRRRPATWSSCGTKTRKTSTRWLSSSLRTRWWIRKKPKRILKHNCLNPKHRDHSFQSRIKWRKWRCNWKCCFYFSVFLSVAYFRLSKQLPSPDSMSLNVDVDELEKSHGATNIRKKATKVIGEIQPKEQG